MQRLDTTANSNYGQRKPKDPAEDYTLCACGNSWFEEFRVSRVSKLHVVIPGQEVPKVGSGPFVLLRCVKCNEIYEPNLTAATTAHIRIYNELMNELRDKDAADTSDATYPAIHPSAPAAVKKEAIEAAEAKIFKNKTANQKAKKADTNEETKED